MRYFCFVLCFLLSSSLFAKPTQEPTKIVNNVYQMLTKYDPNSPTATKEKAKIDAYWLFREISLDAIQDQWSKMNPSQQAKYLVLMKKLLEKTIYEDTGDKLHKGYARVLRQDNLSDERVIVRSRIIVKKNNLNVGNDYGLKKVNGKWMIRDIYIDGQNLADDYRSQYNKIANQYGISGTKDSLLERIENSLNKDADWYNISDEKKDDKTENKKETEHKARPSLVG